MPAKPTSTTVQIASECCLKLSGKTAPITEKAWKAFSGRLCISWWKMPRNTAVPTPTATDGCAPRS